MMEKMFKKSFGVIIVLILIITILVTNRLLSQQISIAVVCIWLVLLIINSLIRAINYYKNKNLEQNLDKDLKIEESNYEKISLALLKMYINNDIANYIKGAKYELTIENIKELIENDEIVIYIKIKKKSHSLEIILDKNYNLNYNLIKITNLKNYKGDKYGK